ncbi:unnamed protein product [Angiostrongylus costaricensis]|uniref:Complex I-B14.7 n=1 Tax=Angiostrongylus costaricensis TaxID=334426 RepID=A0A0R3PCT0_ANGCS|nr:unnamed protein product [Angiostrongylus costaricensis]
MKINSKGRPDWWKELGVRDEVVRSGKWRVVRHRYKEEDPEYFDPKVADGTSISGPFGLDSRYHRNLTIKTDQPMKLDDFQTKVWKGSHQYKNIAEKYNLSEEHPGFDVSPTLNDLVAMLPITMLEIRATGSVPAKEFSPRKFAKRYFQLMPKPTIAAFSWGFALSSAAVMRNKDDVKNHLFSSAAVGAVVASMKDNIPLGLTFAGVSLILGTVWHYCRISEEGIQGRTMHPTSAGMWGGPIIWKAFHWGDAEVPQSRF